MNQHLPPVSAPPFEIIEPTSVRVPVLAHVPHASRVIPPDVRGELLVDDAELALEIVRLTDHHSDDLFGPLGEHGATLFVNRLSRLVFDPERFVDPDLEPTEQIGQGVVYARGSQRQRLRKPDPALRAQRIEALYRPYHAALDDVVGAMLDRFGSCLVIDCHSFPSVPLPSELDQGPDRPDVCIGTDRAHTPPELVQAMEQGFAAEGFSVQRDRPFKGTFVPAGYYGKDTRVRSVMVEVRRGLYIDEETAQRRADYPSVKDAIERAMMRAGVFELDAA